MLVNSSNRVLGLVKSGLPSVILTKHISGQHFNLPDQLQTYHTTRPISASMASSIDFAATGGGTKMALASAGMGYQSCALYVESQGVEPLTWPTASRTVANTGRSKWVVPGFFGFCGIC